MMQGRPDEGFMEGILEYYVVICRACRKGHNTAALPARPGQEGETKCPYCGRTNPGWVVFGPFSNSFFLNIPAGGGRQRVQLTVGGKSYQGVVVESGMDGRVRVLWDDPAFQAQWGNQMFPPDKLEKVLG